MMAFFSGIAELERDLIRERTSAGRQAARKEEPVLADHESSYLKENLARRLVPEGKAVRELAVAFKVHALTIYGLASS